MRVWNGYTGKVENVRPFAQSDRRSDFEAPPWTFADVQSKTPNAPAIADYLGVPVQWVIVAGVVLFVLPYLFKRAGR